MTPLSRRRRVIAETALAVVIFGASAWWGTRYWSASIAAGHEPIFYQEYFEPAVMMTCGRGFGVAFAKLPPSLDRFLNRRADEFSCADLPAQLELTDKGVRQKAMKYLLAAVSLTWRITGRISWSGLSPLCGALFGATTLLAYGILRIGMSWWIACAGTAALATSTLQLQNAPSLRDYAKAPFALALILLLGCLVRVRPSWRAVLAISVTAGVALGIGYGFRSDLLIYIPLFLLVLVLFLDGGIRRHLALKAAGAAAFLGAFLVAAWPIVTTISTEGGCEWHVALLGLSTQFDDELRMEPAPYQVSYRYLDDFMYHSVAAYAARRGGPGGFAPCSRDYDIASRQYFTDIVTMVPADMVARAYASARGMWDLPFRSEGPPLDDWFPLLYRARAKALMNLDWIEPGVIVLALLGLAARDLRWAGAATLVLLYLGGYPALQSNARHYFHLEFITWWALGWIASAGIGAILAARTTGVRNAVAQILPNPRGAVRRSFVFAATIVIILAVALAAVRWQQQRGLRKYFDAYISASKLPLHVEDAQGAGTRVIVFQPTAGQPSDAAAQSALVELDFDSGACGATTVDIVYETTKAGSDFSWTLALPPDRGAGVTRVFFPAYEGFRGVRAGHCLRSAYQAADVRLFPVLMTAALAPGWEQRPLYQRIK